MTSWIYGKGISRPPRVFVDNLSFFEVERSKLGQHVDLGIRLTLMYRSA